MKSHLFLIPAFLLNSFFANGQFGQCTSSTSPTGNPINTSFNSCQGVVVNSLGIGVTAPIDNTTTNANDLLVKGMIRSYSNSKGITMYSASGNNRFGLKWGEAGQIGGNNLALTNREVNGDLLFQISGWQGGASGESTQMRINGNSGFVGINLGSNQPTANFHSYGSARLQNLGSLINPPRVLVSDISGNVKYINTSDLISGNVTLNCNTTDYVTRVSSTGTLDCSTIYDDGSNAAIGNTSPWINSKLHLGKAINSNDIIPLGSPELLVVGSEWSTSTTSPYTVAEFRSEHEHESSVGIKIRGARNNLAYTDASRVDLANYDDAFDAGDNNAREIILARVAADMIDPTGNEGCMRLKTNTGSGLDGAVFIGSDGSVGIGPSSQFDNNNGVTSGVPSGFKLHVGGTIAADDLPEDLSNPGLDKVVVWDDQTSQLKYRDDIIGSGTGGDDDWYVLNTTNLANSITQDLYTQGDVFIGGGQNFEGRLRVLGHSDQATTFIQNTFPGSATNNQATIALSVQANGAFQNNGVISIATGTGDNTAGFFESQNGTDNIGIIATGSTFAGIFNGDILVNATTYSSDRQFKKKINNIENAREILSQLTPKTYEFKTDEFSQFNFSEGRHFGLIAQELQEVLPELVRSNHKKEILDSSGKLIAESVDFLSVNYVELIPYLIQGYKEQLLTMKNQNDRIDELEQKLSELEKNRFGVGQNKIEGASSEPIFLSQNRPNPFKDQTIIEYKIPEEYSSSEILVFNMNGILIKTFELEGIGDGQIVINGNELTPGMYLYSLMVDGEEVNTKRMILTE